MIQKNTEERLKIEWLFLLLVVICVLCLVSCDFENRKTIENQGGGKKEPVTIKKQQKMTYFDKARELSQSLMIVDGHVDFPDRVRALYLASKSKKTTLLLDGEGDFDYKRAKKGGLNAPFMSIYVPPSYQVSGGAKRYADSLIDMVVDIVDQHSDLFRMVMSPEEIVTAMQTGQVSLPMGIENGAAIESDLGNIKHFYDRGVRYMTLTHAKDNLICDSSYDKTKTWGGLSDFGKKVVREMNKVGMMIDVSHISDDSFYDVMATTMQPVVATHSSCRHFTPGFQRNMSDEMIEMLAEKGGVIMVNFGSSFLDRGVFHARKKWKEGDGEKPLATIQDVVNHIDHIVKLVGIDFVGLGSDFDGVGDTLPKGLDDAAGYPNLIVELLKRGYTDQDIQKLCGYNIIRVWKSVVGGYNPL